jgi:titin
VAGRSYTLAAGLATLELGGRDAQARIDRVLLTDDSTFTPTEQAVGDQTPPSSDSGFTASGATTQVTLNWTNSSSADFSKTIIRYRTDGKFPVSPVDGFAVVTKTGAAGSADSFVHTGLTSGTTYLYSAFALDASGNVAPAVTASATAQDTTAPAAVQNLRRSDKKTP